MGVCYSLSLLRKDRINTNSYGTKDEKVKSSIIMSDQKEEGEAFRLSNSEREKVHKFVEQQRAEYLKDVKVQWNENPPAPGSPDYERMKFMVEVNAVNEGACGGAVTYSFTPTTIGMAKTVLYFLTQQTTMIGNGNYKRNNRLTRKRSIKSFATDCA
jgi:hypothetical protein